MAWIETVPEDVAQGELQSIYDSQRKQAGEVANIIKAYSLSRQFWKVICSFIVRSCMLPGLSAANAAK